MCRLAVSVLAVAGGGGGVWNQKSSAASWEGMRWREELQKGWEAEEKISQIAVGYARSLYPVLSRLSSNFGLGGAHHYLSGSALEKLPTNTVREWAELCAGSCPSVQAAPFSSEETHTPAAVDQSAGGVGEVAVVGAAAGVA